MDYGDDITNFNLKLSLLEAVYVHNHNIHRPTGYRPVDLINNKDEVIYKRAMENIKNFKK